MINLKDKIKVVIQFSKNYLEVFKKKPNSRDDAELKGYIKELESNCELVDTTLTSLEEKIDNLSNQQFENIILPLRQ